MYCKVESIPFVETPCRKWGWLGLSIQSNDISLSLSTRIIKAMRWERSTTTMGLFIYIWHRRYIHLKFHFSILSDGWLLVEMYEIVKSIFQQMKLDIKNIEADSSILELEFWLFCARKRGDPLSLSVGNIWQFEFA